MTPLCWWRGGAGWGGWSEDKSQIRWSEATGRRRRRGAGWMITLLSLKKQILSFTGRNKNVSKKRVFCTEHDWKQPWIKKMVEKECCQKTRGRTRGAGKECCRVYCAFLYTERSIPHRPPCFYCTFYASEPGRLLQHEALTTTSSGVESPETWELITPHFNKTQRLIKQEEPTVENGVTVSAEALILCVSLSWVCFSLLGLVVHTRTQVNHCGYLRWVPQAPAAWTFAPSSFLCKFHNLFFCVSPVGFFPLSVDLWVFFILLSSLT